MIAGGEDPKFIARRVIVFASEDVGNADPRALEIAVAAARAVEFVGLPEARINLAQAVAYVALAPKSNAAITAIDAALAEVRRSGNLTPPASIRDGHYPGAKALGRGKGYVYPHSHGGFEPTQRYLPDELGDTRFYEPSENGFEGRCRSCWQTCAAVATRRPARELDRAISRGASRGRRRAASSRRSPAIPLSSPYFVGLAATARDSLRAHAGSWTRATALPCDPRAPSERRSARRRGGGRARIRTSSLG